MPNHVKHNKTSTACINHGMCCLFVLYSGFVTEPVHQWNFMAFRNTIYILFLNVLFLKCVLSILKDMNVWGLFQPWITLIVRRWNTQMSTSASTAAIYFTDEELMFFPQIRRALDFCALGVLLVVKLFVLEIVAFSVVFVSYQFFFHI